MFVWHYPRRPLIQAALLFCISISVASAQSEQLSVESRHGKELMREGRFEEATRVYQDLVKALPGNPGLLLNLGLAEEMAGHPDAAIPHFQLVLRQEPNNLPALTSLAMSRLQLNQPAEALPPLQKLIAIDPKNVDARGMLAGAEMSLSHYEEAARQYRQLTATAPDDPKAWYGLGKAYEALAAQTFDRLNKDAPQSGFIALLLADSRVQQRQYRSAFFFYREAQKKTPDLPGLHGGLAQVYRTTGHPDWAAVEEQRESSLVTAACLSPADSACRFDRRDYLPISKALTGKTSPSDLFWATRAFNQLALEAFDHLGKLPDSIELHTLKAQILHDHGQDLEASQEWRSALALSPDKHDDRLQTELATSLFLAHDYPSALPLIRALLAADPNSPDLNFMLGESLWRSQQAEAALPYLETALRKSPEMLPAHAALGLALASLTRSAEAIPHLEKAISLDDDGSLHYSLARAYQSAGDKDHARQNMAAYTEIQQHNAAINADLAKEAEITAPDPVITERHP